MHRAIDSRLLLAGALLFGGCVPGTLPNLDPINPFEDLAAVPIDGLPHQMETTVAALGPLERDRVLRIEAGGEGIDRVMILAEDPLSDASGLIAGGGPGNAVFQYRVQVPGRYFVYVQFDPALPNSRQRAVLTVGDGDPAYAPPVEQVVRVIFAPGYLTQPGLFDLESSTTEDLAVLESISDTVRAQVMNRLREIFADTPIRIIDESEPPPAGPFSTLTFRPERVPLEEGIPFDAAIPGVDPNTPCVQPVIFGEVLPRGTQVDPGNTRTDDEAVVYVGSFQGRGAACRSAVITSVSTVVLALAQTGAHEIGHLVGLYHTALVDIMDRQPSLAFQRELGLERSQILLEVPVPNAAGVLEPQPVVLTTIIQAPAFYFQANFSGR